MILLAGLAYAAPTLTTTRAPPEPLLDALAVHLRLDGRVLDQKGLVPIYEAACAARPGLACQWRAWDDRGLVRPKELARLAEPVCTAGDPVACVAWGWALGLGDGTWNGPGVGAAETHLRTACTAGVGRACTELGALGTARDLPGADPLALHARACALGVSVGCLRAAAIAPNAEQAATFRRGAGDPPDGADACDAGWTLACVGLLDARQGPSRLPTLEALCHRDAARFCPVLAVEQVAAAPADLPAADLPAADSAWVVPGGVLLGWRGTSFTDHALVRFSALDRVELRQETDQVADRAVLVGAGREWPLPIPTCSGIVEAVRTWNAGGVEVRAVGSTGGPARSMCIENAGPDRPTCHGGGITVVPRLPDDSVPAAERRAALDAAGPDLFACLESTSPRGALVAEIVHRRGRPSKVKLVHGTRDPAFDACALGWMSTTDLGTAPATMRYTVRTELW